MSEKQARRPRNIIGRNVKTMCDFRMGEYCFNPKKVRPGIVAMPCHECSCEAHHDSE
ncbi:MAG: hypothetical protein V1725_06800 [archaeon]